MFLFTCTRRKAAAMERLPVFHCFPLFSNIFLHHLMSLPEIREVKHLHQLQADIENLFNYSPQSSICLTFQWNTKQIFFPMNTDDTIVPHSNSCPPNFRLNAYINNFSLLYCLIPPALPMELSRNVVYVWVIAGYYLIQSEHWINWQINQQIILISWFKLLHVKL